MFTKAIRCILFVFSGFAAACTGSSDVFGPGNPRTLKGVSKPVSGQFGAAETKELYREITSRAFRNRLASYTCGDPVPNFAVTLAFRPERTANERLVFIYTDPELGTNPRDLCLALGFDYEVARALRLRDHGPPLTYTMTDGRTVTATRPLLQRPICDCARRDSGDMSWVDLKDDEQ